MKNIKINKKIYFLISFIYFFYYCFLNYFHNEYDFLHFYEIILKEKENYQLYKDFTIWYGPYLILFIKILKKLLILEFSTILILGYVQNLILGFVTLGICKIFIKDKDFYVHIFAVSLIWINPSIHQLYWDYYTYLFGLLGIYFFLKEKYLTSAFFFSIIFFLKQTQGIIFILILLSILMRDFVAKKYNYKVILYFIIFTLLHLLFIKIFYDFDTYYKNSINFIYPYADSLYGVNSDFFVRVILQFFKLQFDQHIIFDPSFWRYSNNAAISYYLLFIAPFHLLMIYFILNIKKFAEGYFLFIFLILILNAAINPLIGRGYFSKVFALFVCSYILIDVFKNKTKWFKNTILTTATLLYISFGVIYNVAQINFDENLIIRNNKIKYLSINYNFYKNRDIFFDSKEVYNLILRDGLKNIFVTGNLSRAPVILSNQASVNYELYFYPVWQAPVVSGNDANFNNVLATEFKNKSPDYLISEKKEYEKFLSNNQAFLKVLVNYKLYFQNNNFVIYKKKSVIL
jgi:hypothetical protein